ncbi:MAG TPA: hypothetical protein VJP85_12560 [Candidatus Baltobacteraceae bacterium]|nr:hypothetical protein [Candidatus Baltobacteraceae bacterium]
MSATYALALPESRVKRQAQLYGTRAQLAVGNGDVEGYLALAGCDRRAGTASYALRIINQSQHLLRARMTCARLRGEAILAYPLDIHIAPFSISETLLPVRIADIGPYERAIVEVAGGDVAFSLEAPAPPRMGKRPRWIMATAASLALTLGTAFAAAASTPRLALLAAPDRVLRGMTVDVPYAFGGWASMQYQLQTRDGRQLSAGLLKSHEGTLHFTVPPTAGPNVVLSVDVQGPFGRQSRSQKIAISGNAAQKPRALAATAPRISEFAVATPIVRAGSSMKLTYTTDARDGEIWLIDDAGRLWARAAISPYGTTTLEVPQGAAGRQMRAVMHARNDKLDTVASVGVLVMPGAIAAEAQSAATAQKTPTVGMTLSAQQAAPGDLVTVMIDGNHGDARITMTDDSGQSVDQGDIPSTQNAATLTAPSVTQTTTYYVMASVSQGVGEQTLVRKLVVSPRGSSAQ